MAYQITTNSHKRLFSHRDDVPEKVLRDQFDYQDPEEAQGGFLRYKGCWYHIDQFMLEPDTALDEALHIEARELGYDKSPNFGFEGWDGYRPDSFYSGVLIKVSDDFETYTVATYIHC